MTACRATTRCLAVGAALLAALALPPAGCGRAGQDRGDARLAQCRDFPDRARRKHVRGQGGGIDQ